MKLVKCSFAFVAALATGANAEVITGTITDWPESGPVMQAGDDVNHVSMFWSINTFDLGWFYGSAFTSDTDVAVATGVTDISEITDASIYTYTSGSIGPVGDADHNASGIGTFLVLHNINTGHYGAIRVDDIHDVDLNIPYAELDLTWWFQTDGSADLSGGGIDGDIDGDGDVDFDDFSTLLASWGDPGCGGALPCPADLDGDGDVDFDDFTTLLANWT